MHQHCDRDQFCLLIWQCTWSLRKSMRWNVPANYCSLLATRCWAYPKSLTLPAAEPLYI